MINAEELNGLKGKTIWFRSAESDMNSGIVMGVSFPEASYARVECQSGKHCLVWAKDMFSSREELIDANQDKFLSQNIYDRDYQEQVDAYKLKGQTVDGIIKLYRDYDAIKKALKACSEEILNNDELFGLLS